VLSRSENLGLAVLAIMVAAGSFGAGKIVRPTPYDPILNGRPAGACDPQLGGANVVAGVDVRGRPVALADTDRGRGLNGVDAPEVWVRAKNGAYVRVAGIGQAAPKSCSAGR
jgi:hypothetical protein